MAPFCGSNAVVMSSFVAADGSRRLAGVVRAAAQPWASARGSRRGVTLVELLVVISILLVLTAVAVPMMQPSLEGRRTREAARAIHVYFTSARIRAMETGRPVGVMFERLPEQAEACRVLRQAEVPPPYAGDFANSRIVIGSPNLQAMSATVSFSNGEDPVGLGLVRPGDLLRLNYQGHFWRIETISGGAWTFSSETAAFPPGFDSSVTMLTLPFQIFRQPVPSAAAPMQLPAGAVVDLVASGTDTAQPNLPPAGAADRTPVVVMFSPTGSVDRVYYGGLGFRVTEPIFLLVGKWGRMPLAVGGGASAEDGLLNWQDATNLWVALTPQTGLVTVAPLFADQLDAGTNTYLPSSMFAARNYARRAQVSMGGR